MNDLAPRRRLSVPRLMVAILVTGALVTAGVFTLGWARASAEDTVDPWFAGYADVTATPAFAFESPQSAAGKNVVLSFVVAASQDSCEPSWGAAYTLDQASGALDLDRRIARLQQVGGEVAVSFGGQANRELAAACTDLAGLEKAYTEVIDRYDLTTIDLDIEGASLADTAASERRAEALAAVQSARRAAGKSLAVWFTLPVTPDGIDSSGQKVIGDALAHKVDVAGVNAMTMDYGSSLLHGATLETGAEQSVTALHRQLGGLYKQAHITLSDKTLWNKIGVTPMIGQNDVRQEVFSLQDARRLSAFAIEQGIGRVSMWSLNRDASCGSNYVTLKVVSTACSGIDQKGKRFADLLGASLHGKPAFAAANVTSDEPSDPAQQNDDPASSPYPVWQEGSAYLQGTKIVWHHNVYQAKWWTRGDVPDDPVLNDWQTPWQLVGPVLPGETPIPQPTLPAGTYPQWTGSAVFDKGDRVLFDGTPYEAKWWNQGQSPEAASSDPGSSPWAPLTVAQIQQLLAVR